WSLALPGRKDGRPTTGASCHDAQFMPSDSRAEAVVATAPGEVITDLLLRCSVRCGRPVPMQASAAGTVLPVAPRWLRGEGHLTVTADGDGTRVVLEGEPPPWPWRARWARRTLRGLL